jgi:2-oxoglutaroyl-CoA hydrolase
MSYPEGLDGLRYEKDEAAKPAYVIFDRPPMNVISYPARAQIAKLIAAMDEDDDIRIIVIRGAHGPYSSGGNIAGLRSRYKSPSSANAAL